MKTLSIVFVVSVHLPVALASPWLSKGGFLVTNLWGTLSQRKTFPPSFDDDVVLGWPSTKGWSISCLPASHKDNFTVFHNYAGSKTLAPRLPWSFVGFKQHNICNYAFWFFLPLHCRIMTVIEDLRRAQYRDGLKSGPVCYATARPGQAEHSRNLGTTFLPVIHISFWEVAWIPPHCWPSPTGANFTQFMATVYFVHYKSQDQHHSTLSCFCAAFPLTPLFHFLPFSCPPPSQLCLSLQCW